jgi:hypothetical protein
MGPQPAQVQECEGRVVVHGCNGLCQSVTVCRVIDAKACGMETAMLQGTIVSQCTTQSRSYVGMHHAGRHIKRRHGRILIQALQNTAIGQYSLVQMHVTQCHVAAQPMHRGGMCGRRRITTSSSSTSSLLL